jgi:ribosome-associated translation inhibitor RaiA
MVRIDLAYGETGPAPSSFAAFPLEGRTSKMKIPLQISFHDMPVSPALETLIREKAGKLEQFHPNMTGCRVVVDKPHHHSQQGEAFSVTIEVSVPGANLVVNHVRNEDANVAVRDAFLAARRQVEDHIGRQRAEVRGASLPPTQEEEAGA